MKQGSWYEKNSHPAEAKSNTSKVSYSSHTDENIADEVSYDYCSNEEMNEDRLLATSAASESFHRSVLENQVKRTALNRSNTSRLIQNNNNNNNINTATNLLKKEITRQNKTTSNRISQNHFESQVILEKQSDKCFHISRYARYKLCKLKGHSGTIVVKQLVPTAEAFISKLKSPTSAVGTRNDNDDNNEEEDNDEGDISNAPPEVVQKFRDVLLREADTIAAAFNSKINYTTSTETIAALIGITPETHSILMDFHACGSLDDWIVQRVPIKWMDRWIIARDAVNGMCHLHSIGIVHGNLRCHNILMAYDDRKKVTVRISDYGFHETRKMAFGNNIFAHGINRPYTAPELIHHTLIPTLSSDVYSFSIILLRLSLSSSNQPAHRHASILRKNYEEILRTQQYVMEEMNNDGKGVIVVALLPVWIKWLVDVGMTAFDPRKRPPFTFIARVIAVNKQNTFIHEAITVYKDVRVLGKMERAIRFLKREKKDVKRYGRMRMALFVMIPILVIGIVMAILTLTGKFNNGSSNNSTNTNNNSPGDFQINSPWIGVNSYYLYALPPSSQDTIIAFLASRGVKIIRIIIESPPTNNSGHHPLIPDFEPSHAGANYDYTILRAVDSLMRRTHAAGIKLVIALHNRFALGCGRSDAYALDYNLPTIPNCGISHYNSPTLFYKDIGAKGIYSARIKNILSFVSPNFRPNRTLGSLYEAIYAVDVQNRPGVGVIVEGSDNVVEDWICEMAGIVRNYIQGGILVGSGGSQTFIQSLNSQSSLMSTCESLDIITVSDSGLDLSLSSDVSYVSRALGLVGAGISKKKQVVLEGICMQPPAPPSISSSLQYKYEENVKLVLNMTLAAGVSWVGTEVNNDEAGFISTSSSDIGCTTSRFNSIDSDWIQNIL